MRNICFFTTLIIANSFSAQTFNYLPSKVSNHQIIAYQQFTLSYNETHEQADWVAYELTKDEVNSESKRCDCFKKDKTVTTESASPSDYTSTGFDKGHYCPSADCYFSDEANKESFLMSNITPQLPLFNRGIWSELEEWVRKQAVACTSLYVVTGPVFANNLGTISSDSITIPGYYYKTLLRFEGNKIKTIAFLIPHVGAFGKLKDYVVSINTIETITGIDFYPEIDDSEENKVESQVELKKWGL